MTQFHKYQNLDVCQLPCLSDNYGFLVHDRESGDCAAIDTPDADAINAALESQDWQLSHIFNTHWHPDHTGGNEVLKAKWNCHIIGPSAENGRIPAADELIGESAEVFLGNTKANVMETPGHTTGHIVYHFADDDVAFVGDTLFALGCGRLFEGTPDQMWSSLQKLRALPDKTAIFCAHEYTAANAAFAITADPENTALMQRFDDIKSLRERNIPTVPTSIKLEKATNPFLRADALPVQAAMGLNGADPTDVFAEVRRRKDNF